MKNTPRRLSDFTSKKAMKLEVAKQIAAHIRESGLSQAEAAKQYNIDAGIVSHVCNANLDPFTLDRLLGIAEIMGVVGVINFKEGMDPK